MRSSIAGNSDDGPRGDCKAGRDDEWLFNYVYDARVYNPETLMPPFGRHHLLEAGEIQRIVDYLLALPAAAAAAAEDPALPQPEDSATAVAGVVEAGRKSDAQAQQLTAGKANLVDVVTAVSETEVAVETMVSIRDKVIAAYEEIMRMPI